MTNYYYVLCFVAGFWFGVFVLALLASGRENQ